MSLEVIYVVRHGFRSNWLVDPSTGDYSATIRSPTGIAADPALTAHGVDQANELGAALMMLVPPIEAVFSSPYYRCLQTISPFIELSSRKRELSPQPGSSNSPASSMPRPGPVVTTIRPEHGIAEWYGDAEFEHPRPASPQTLKGMFPAYDQEYLSATEPSAKGETVAELHDRVAGALQEVIQRCDAEGLRAVVLCTHAAVVIALGRVLTGVMPPNVDVEDFRAFTCGLSTYRRRRSDDWRAQQPSGSSNGKDVREDREVKRVNVQVPSWKGGRGIGGGWMCELDSDCSFLTRGAERGWRFSGEESFKNRGKGSQEDAGIALGIVVESPQSERPHPKEHREHHL